MSESVGSSLEVSGLIRYLGGRVLLDHISFTVGPGECWGCTGASGSGKTILLQALAGQVPVSGRISYDLDDRFGMYPAIAFVQQQHQFRNLSNRNDFYYQQRYNSFDAEDSLTIEQYLASFSGPKPSDELLKQWGLWELRSKPLIQLSNGENKRLQLVQALSAGPAVLLLDNPFTGLDTAGRVFLLSRLRELRSEGVLLIIAGRISEMDGLLSHVLELREGRIGFKGSLEIYRGRASSRDKFTFTIPLFRDYLVPALKQDLIRMEGVSVRYGENAILTDIYWRVEPGQHWTISGPNGAGKSTLISLVTGDNPQAYSNPIWLFGKKRGSGETIWEIKKNIGYVSPELHLSFEQGISVADVIASGFFDTIGLFRPLREDQELQVLDMIRAFGLEQVRTKSLYELPLGGQRLVLLARALIKRPPLLILDEPCQGLDEWQSADFRELVNQICQTTHITLIYISHYERDIPDCIRDHLKLDRGRIIP